MAEPAKITALPPTYDNPLMAHSNLILVAGLVTILTTLIVPLPTFLLDMLSFARLPFVTLKSIANEKPSTA